MKQKPNSRRRCGSTNLVVRLLDLERAKAGLSQIINKQTKRTSLALPIWA